MCRGGNLKERLVRWWTFASGDKWRLSKAARQDVSEARRVHVVGRLALAIGRKSYPWPFSTWATAENARGFRGRQSPHPAAAGFFRPLLGLLAATGLCLGGCGAEGPALGNVTGTVFFDNEPLANARVVFRPPQGRTSVGTTDAAGRYKLDYTPVRQGALLGEHVVTVTWTPPDAPDADQTPAPVNSRPRTVSLPAVYNSRSKLRAVVREGSNEIDFRLDAKGT